MQPRRGPLLAHGSRTISKTVQPDDQKVKVVLLNLTGIVGLLFLGLALLHLTYGLATSHAFHAYIALFLFLEAIFIAARLYSFFRGRSRLSKCADDEETGIIFASKGHTCPPPRHWNGRSFQGEPPPLYWISKSTENTKGKNVADRKGNSL